MKRIIIVTLTLLCGTLNAQENQNKLSFEFGYSINGFAMGKFNEFYIDSFAAKPENDFLRDKITSGRQFYIGLVYQPIGLFDVGIYGSYQYANSRYDGLLIREYDQWGNTTKYHHGSYDVRTEAIAAGLTTTWYFSHLLRFHEKNKLLNRLHFGIELNVGMSFSKAKMDMLFPTFPIIFLNDYASNNDFHGQTGLKVEYIFVRSPLITSVGIRPGYQILKTKSIKDRLNNEWGSEINPPLNLDFSGFYFGTYFKIGR